MNWRKKAPFGSPPRVRGRLIYTFAGRSCTRFTPACAGKTTVSESNLKTEAVHPRVCGEDDRASQILFSRSGSPPRVRGRQRLDCNIEAVRDRFTPACAGKTTVSESNLKTEAVHPRVCGEDDRAFADFHASSRSGSPPRVRGRLGFVSISFANCERFTPACAGKTRSAMNRPIQTAVHPRVCGEDKVSANCWE